MRFPHLAHRSAADHKLHSTRQQHEMKLISGNGETSSRLPAFSLFLPGTCPNNRDRRITYKGQAVDVKQVGRELGVRYVLEGSVRKAGNRVRITGQ